MKNKLNTIIFTLLALVSLNASAHEYYIAIFEVNLSKDEKSIQISAKFIAHDVEESLMKNDYPYLNLGSEKELANADSLLFTYIQQHFSISVNKQKLTPQFIGKEVELDEDLWVYFEFPITQKPKEITIQNTCLITEFSSHQNITHVTIRGNMKSYVFTKQHIEEFLKL